MARFGMVSKFLAHTGRRSELVELLLAATRTPDVVSGAVQVVELADAGGVTAA